MSIFAAVMISIAASDQMATITGGEYRPLYMKDDSRLVMVNDFKIDTVPVTNADFFLFTKRHSQWQKPNIPALFAEQDYLSHWDATGLMPNVGEEQQAVVNVSWFAADAYCRQQGKRLPTVDEWEYVAMASETQVDGSSEQGYHQRILDWYAKPTAGVNVGQGVTNYWGVSDLHGVVWEWTSDFNSALTSGESRGDSSVNTDLYCAAAASGSADPSDYAAFMRYGFRSSLQAKFTINNLGFRCAQDVEKDNNL